MPNIANVLKEEIARVARKEMKGEHLRMKKASTQQRGEIVSLKRRLQAMEQQLVKLRKAVGAAASPGRGRSVVPSVRNEAPSNDGEGATRLRFSAKGLAKQRQRLGISAADAGRLIGVSGQSIYHWEAGKARPRAGQLPAIAAMRKLSKREAAAQLGRGAVDA